MRLWAYGIPKSSSSPNLDTKEAGLWGTDVGKPLRVDLKWEGGTLASSFSPPSPESPDIGFLAVGMDELYGSQRDLRRPWSLIPAAGGRP